MSGEISGALFENITESNLITSAVGKVFGFIVASHTSGTLKLTDGTEGGVAASVVLTSAGASAPADYATSTLTSDETNVSVDDVVVIGTTTYRFKSTMLAAYDVKIGADAATTLDNLKAAINGTGTAGVEYFAGTVAHPLVIATTNADTTQIIRAKIIGVAPNSYATTTTAAHLSWTSTVMAGGVAATVATVTLGSTTYTAIKTLPESLGFTPVPYYVLWETSEAVFLDNLKQAVNASGIAGTDYSAGTEEHPTVYATTNTNTEQTFVAKAVGTVGNSIASTETLGNYSFASATLLGGTGANARVLMDTYTFASGSQVVSFPEPVNFVNGLYATVGGTAANVTILYR
jgi:hypothetical protein